MPTYTNPNTTAHVEAGVTVDAGETKTTPLTLTEITVTLPSPVAGLGLELVTEAGSGATGRIYWISGAVVGLVEVSGTFTGEAALTADVTGAMGTPAAGALVVNLTRDAATGFYNQLVDRQTVTATAAGTEDVYLHRETTWVMVVTVDVALVIQNGAAADEVIELPAGVWMDRNDQRYQHLQITFAEAGSCKVLEFNSDYNPISYSDFGEAGSAVLDTLEELVDVSGGLVCKARERIAVGDVAVSLTGSLVTHAMYGASKKVIISVEENDIRKCQDGSTPVQTGGSEVGMVIYTGSIFSVLGNTDIGNFEAIAKTNGAAADIEVEYYY